MNKCKRCGQVLVHHEFAHAVEGELYCSKSCAIEDLTDEYAQNVKEMAIEKYNELAEVVRTEEVLAEDLQDFKITVICSKTIKLPRTLPKHVAITEAIKLYSDGFVNIEPTDCDEVDIKCELVNENSSCEEAN